MKHTIFNSQRSILHLILLFAFSTQLMAQQPANRTRQRPSEAGTESVVNLTERAKIKNESESKKPAHIVWERIIYRQVDLMKEENNAALYYPELPQGDRQNLFALMFKLLADNKVNAYKYEERGEVFTEAKKEDFEKILKQKLQVIYTKEGNRFKVEDQDIPSQEVTQYLIKEGYFFDQATGTFKTEVLAIAPILVREDFYYGNSVKEPLFWMQYDDIRPYLSREMIMTSNYNNTLTYTIDDYFRKNMYTGEIIKTVNMMGKGLSEQVGADPDALKQAQDSIEKQLKVFNEELWVYNDSTKVKMATSAKTKEAKVKDDDGTKRTNREVKQATPKSTATKSSASKPKSSSSSKSAPKSSDSGATRSVRRN